MEACRQTDEVWILPQIFAGGERLKIDRFFNLYLYTTLYLSHGMITRKDCFHTHRVKVLDRRPNFSAILIMDVSLSRVSLLIVPILSLLEMCTYSSYVS